MKPLRCRCQNKDGSVCHNPVKEPTLFCSQHQKCGLSPMSGWEPEFDPKRYNGDEAVQSTHNCFSYAMNVIDPNQVKQCKGNPRCRPYFHQPGATRKMSKLLYKEENRNCKVVERLMDMDVPIKRTTFRRKCPAKMSKIAITVHPGEDYHVLRQDSDGIWSHKDGGNPVKRFDADGQDILDPKTANRDYRPRSFLNYKDFCGYYCVPRDADHPINLSRSRPS